MMRSVQGKENLVKSQSLIEMLESSIKNTTIRY